MIRKNNFLSKIMVVLIIMTTIFSCQIENTVIQQVEPAGQADTTGIKIAETGAVILIGSNTKNIAVQASEAVGKTLIDATTQSIDIDTINEECLVVADMNVSLTENHQDIFKTAVRKNAILLLENAQKEKMKDFALVPADSETIVLVSMGNGQYQKTYIEADSGAVRSGQKTSSTSKSITIIALIKEEMAEKKSLMWNNIINVNQSHAQGQIIINEYNWNPTNGNHCTIKGQFDFDLAAVSEIKTETGEIITNPQKWLRIKSTESSVRVSNMTWNSDHNKGYFTTYGRVLYFPGTYGGGYINETPHTPLPAGWVRQDYQPRTTNAQTTYVSTTGFSIGSDISGGASETGANMGAKVSATYSQSQQVSQTIQDFRVINKSTAGVSDWTYEYSRFADDPENLIDVGLTVNIVNPPSAATTTFDMQNETIYSLPKDASGTQDFTFYLEQKVSHLEIDYYVLGYHWDVHTEKQCITEILSINLDQVVFPGDKGLKANYYDWQWNWKATEHVPNINFNWGHDVIHNTIGGDQLIVTWTGFIKPSVDGFYDFHTKANDGVILYVNDKRIIDHWTQLHETIPFEERTGNTYLSKDRYYPIKLQYFEYNRDAFCHLSWTIPGSSEKEIIPMDYLYSGKFWD